MGFRSLFTAASMTAVLLGAGSAGAQTYTSDTSQISGGVLVNFEGMAEGALISNQFAGVTFGQTPSGRPQIDNLPQPWGYGASSGAGVLTGSIEGGHDYTSLAGINATFTSGHNAVEFFFSDTVPLGSYPIVFYGAGGSVLGSLTLAQLGILPDDYKGGIFPAAGTTPLPGLFVGFTSAGNDIFGIGIGPGSTAGDAFAIDDLRWTTNGDGGGVVVPEPTTWAMMLLGFAGLGTMLRRRRMTVVAG